MKRRFKFPPRVTLGSIQSQCTTKLETVSQQSKIANKLSKLGIRLFRAVLLVPVMVSGMGYIPAAAQAQLINMASNGCPAGTRIGTTNFIINGTFATNAGTGLGVPTGPAAVPPSLRFTSDLPYRGDGLYPNDSGGGGAFYPKWCCKLSSKLNCWVSLFREIQQMGYQLPILISTQTLISRQMAVLPLHLAIPQFGNRQSQDYNQTQLTTLLPIFIIFLTMYPVPLQSSF